MPRPSKSREPRSLRCYPAPYHVSPQGLVSQDHATLSHPHFLMLGVAPGRPRMCPGVGVTGERVERAPPSQPQGPGHPALRPAETEASVSGSGRADGPTGLERQPRTEESLLGWTWSWSSLRVLSQLGQEMLAHGRLRGRGGASTVGWLQTSIASPGGSWASVPFPGSRGHLSPLLPTGAPAPGSPWPLIGPLPLATVVILGLGTHGAPRTIAHVLKGQTPLGQVWGQSKLAANAWLPSPVDHAFGWIYAWGAVYTSEQGGGGGGSKLCGPLGLLACRPLGRDEGCSAGTRAPGHNLGTARPPLSPGPHKQPRLCKEGSQVWPRWRTREAGRFEMRSSSLRSRSLRVAIAMGAGCQGGWKGARCLEPGGPCPLPASPASRQEVPAAAPSRLAGPRAEPEQEPVQREAGGTPSPTPLSVARHTAQALLSRQPRGKGPFSPVLYSVFSLRRDLQTVRCMFASVCLLSC